MSLPSGPVIEDALARVRRIVAADADSADRGGPLDELVSDLSRCSAALVALGRVDDEVLDLRSQLAAVLCADAHLREVGVGLDRRLECFEEALSRMARSRHAR